ncbi:unnamed protein product, partial [Owenia fusiformis]
RFKKLSMGKKTFSDSSKTKPKGAGRVGRLDDNVLGYYRKVSETIQGEFETQEEKDLFLNNVIKQLATECISVSRNQTASRIIEQLIAVSNATQLQVLMKAFSTDWYTVCMDRFASHVVQALILHSPQYFKEKTKDSEPNDGNNNDDGNNNTDAEGSIKDLFTSFSKLVMANLPEFIIHTYASHIVRVVIEVLCGVRVDEHIVRSKISRNQNNKGPHGPSDKKAQVSIANSEEEFKPILKELAARIVSLSEIREHVKNATASPVIQTLLLVLSKKGPKRCHKIINQIFLEEASLGTLAEDEIGSHMVELVLSVLDSEHYDSAYQQHFKGKLLQLALHHTGNFVVQTLLSKAHTKEQFEAMYKELSHHIEDILAANHMGVIVKIAETCVRLGTRQDKFYKNITKAFHCHKPEERQQHVVRLLTSLTAYEVYFGLEVKPTEESDEGDEKDTKAAEPTPVEKELTVFNYHGSMLLQQLLKFGNPKSLVTSILSLTQRELTSMACNPIACHIIESFIKSPSIGETSHDKLYTKLQGCYSVIACDRTGSRVIDTLWNCAILKHKFIMAENLAKESEKLRNNNFGKFVFRNCGIHNFIHRRQDWKENQKGNIRKRKILDGIFDDEKPQNKKRQNDISHEENIQMDDFFSVNGTDDSSPPKNADSDSKSSKQDRFSKKDFGNKKSKGKNLKKDRFKTKSDGQIKDKGMLKLLDDMQPSRKK